tara:strand:+ start:164 stop:1294 length:1131 start_codon:yes stop_codon:yes gene_type:complete
MDFQTQVEALTGLSIGSGVTTAQLSQFLKDGVIDVTNRCVALNPKEANNFSRESSEQTSNGLDLNGAKIISVVRESGTDNDWRGCRQIPTSLQSRVTDINSIHYASKFNPAYCILDNGEVNVFPAPGSNPNAYKAYYVNNVPQDKGGSALIHSHSDIKYFDDSKVYLVILYASIKSLDHMIESVHTMPDKLNSIILNIPTVPTVPSIASQALTFTQAAPVYTPPVTSLDFSDANNWINTEEDSEMLSARIQEIQTKLQEYQMNMQNNLNKFNEENAEYQMEFQRAVQNAQLTSKDEDQAIKKYETEIASYSAQVNREVQEVNKLAAEVQKYSAEVQKVQIDVDIYQKRSAKLQQQYDAAYQVMAGGAQRPPQERGR